jgi:hypothetical protein
MLSTRSFAAALASVLAGALLFTGAAVATPTLDQQQTTLDMDWLIVIGGDRPQTLAQVVTSGTAGLLTQVDLPVECAWPLTVEIRDSGATIPGTVVLASQTVSGLSGEDWSPIVFSNPAFITDETFFAIVLSSPGNCGIYAGPDGADPYPRGNGYYLWPPYPWAPTGADLGFKTYVEAICKVPGLVGGPRAAAMQGAKRSPHDARASEEQVEARALPSRFDPQSRRGEVHEGPRHPPEARSGHAASGR